MPAVPIESGDKKTAPELSWCEASNLAECPVKCRQVLIPNFSRNLLNGFARALK